MVDATRDVSMRALLLALMLSTAFAEPLDRVVAVTDRTPVLASDVRTEQALDAVDRPPAPAWGAREPDAVERLIDMQLIRAQTPHWIPYQPTQRQFEDRYDLLRRTYRSPARWKAFLDEQGTTEERLLTALRRRMALESWLIQRLSLPPDDPAWPQQADALLTELRAGVTVRYPAVIEVP